MKPLTWHRETASILREAWQADWQRAIKDGLGSIGIIAFLILSAYLLFLW